MFEKFWIFSFSTPTFVEIYESIILATNMQYAIYKMLSLKHFSALNIL
jgi:hypothetical protein